MGPVWKFDETQPTSYDVLKQVDPVWKFVKCGPWRMLRVGAFSEEFKASY